MRMPMIAATLGLSAALGLSLGTARATEMAFDYTDPLGASAVGTMDVVNGVAVSGSGTLTIPGAFTDVPIYLIPLTDPQWAGHCNSLLAPTSCTPRTGDGTDFIGVDSKIPLNINGPFFSVGVTEADYLYGQGIGWNPYSMGAYDTYFLAGIGTIDGQSLHLYQGGGQGVFDPEPIPEPMSLGVLAFGLVGLWAARRRA